MAFQWLLGIAFALWVSPLAWEGPVSRTSLHVWAALVVGGAISLFPALLGVFRPGRPSTRYADLTKTRQILLNLLSNAGKFTREGAVAVAVCQQLVDGREYVEFSVTDTGVGMTQEQTRKVFDAFTQADVTTTRKYGGTGLGLAIVSKFCELMGGTVAVESRLGEGSRFVVQLPLAMVETTVNPAAAVGV